MPIKRYVQHRVVGCMIGLAMMGSGVWAAEAPNAAANRQSSSSERDARIELLIADLSNDSWQVRQKAQEALAELGEPIRPRLAQLLNQTEDEEVRTRVETILRQIDEVRHTGQSVITLHLKQATPKQVFAELSRQANADLRPLPFDFWETRPWPAIDVDFESQPFWLALAEVCTKFGMTAHGDAWNRDMVITDPKVGTRIWGKAPFVVQGPFLIVANQIHSSRTVDLHRPEGLAHDCRLQFQLFPEPKIQVLQGSYVAKIDQALDEKGNSLLKPQLTRQDLRPLNNWYWTLTASLSPPADAGRRIATLKGSARCVIQTRSEKAEIPNILAAKNVSKLVAGRRFLLKEVRRQGESYLVHMTLYRSGWSPTEWGLLYPYSFFKLIDAQGNPLQRVPGAGGAGGGGGQREVVLSFRPWIWQNREGSGEPVKLVWELPTESEVITVPFVFTDLPLP